MLGLETAPTAEINRTACKEVLPWLLIVLMGTTDDKPCGTTPACLAGSLGRGRRGVTRPITRAPAIVKAHREFRELAAPPAWQREREPDDRRTVGDFVNACARLVQKADNRPLQLHA